MTGWAYVLALGGCALFLTGACAAVLSRRAWLAAVLVGGLVVRVALAAATKGYPPDIATFSAWAGHAAEGLASFYSPGYFADYPPGYIYVLWVIGTLRQALGLAYDSPAFMVLLKSPAILADLAATWLLYRMAQDRWGGRAAALAALYAFNPAVLLDSAVWGQVDGVLTLPLLLCVLLVDRCPAGSGAAFAAALLIKPQALLFAPLPALRIGLRLLRRDDRPAAARAGAAFLGAAAIVFVLGVSPFLLREGPRWVVGKYAGTMGSYPYASFNAFNLYALVGGNGVEIGRTLLGLPYWVWGIALFALVVALAVLTAVRHPGPAGRWLLATLLPAAAFVLLVEMHERYLFPALAMAMGLFLASGRWWALAVFVGMSVTLFLNTAEVYALSLADSYLVPQWSPLLLSVSAANVFLLALLAAGGWRRPLEKGLDKTVAKAISPAE